MIESNGNVKIKKIQKLKKSARFRRQEKLFVAEGWKMAEEALKRGLVHSLYFSLSGEKESAERLSGYGREVSTEVVSDSLFREMTDTITPQGVLAVVKMPHYDREKLLQIENTVLLCLEDIQDPGNLGTMIRTAEGAGMAGVVMSKGCVDLFNPKVVRSTMGALFRVPFFFCDEITTEVEGLKKEGFTMYAAHPRGQMVFTEETYPGRVGILIGNEANGLSEELCGLADKRVRIPMEGQLESLNAAVSAALFMYEVHRNRR